MSRASRYAELMAAAQLADRDLALEAARGQRDGAQTAALVGLIPALAKAGINIGSSVAANAKQEELMALQNRKLDVAEAAATSREASAAQREADKASRDARDFEYRTQKDQREAVLPEAVTSTRTLDAAPNWRRFIGDDAGNPERLVGPPTKAEFEAGNADEMLSTTAPKVGLTRSQLEAQARESRRKDDTAAANRTDDIARRERFHSDSMASAAASRASAADERALVRDIAAGNRSKDDAKVSNAQADTITALDEASTAMTRIGNEAKKINPNIIKSAWNTALDKVGLPTELTGYVATIRNFNSAIGVLRSGSAIGVQEQARLDSFLVQAGDTVGTVEAKKAAFQQWIKEKRNALNKTRQLQDLPPLPFESSTSTPAGATSFQED